MAVGAHAVASHRSAARLHGFDGFADTTIVEVSVSRAHRWRHRDGTIAHHVDALESPDIVQIDGIRCTGLARTLVDLGSVCDEALTVRRALTDVRRRGASLRWVQSTAERLHRSGQRGSGVLLRQLATIPYEGRVPDSWFEELLARCLADDELGPVIPQLPIRRVDGRIVARTDIGLPDVKLGLEAHSRTSTSVRRPSRSTSSATSPPPPAGGSCSTSAGMRRSDRPRCWRSSSTSSPPAAAYCDTLPRDFQGLLPCTRHTSRGWSVSRVRTCRARTPPAR